MSNRIHALAQQLTGKASIDECSLEELQHIARRHPYFSSAQFLFLQKLRQLNSPEAEAQYKKAVLFYPDPLLFDYFISSDKFYVDESNLIDHIDHEDDNVPTSEVETEDSGYSVESENSNTPDSSWQENNTSDVGHTNEEEIFHALEDSNPIEQAQNVNIET